MDTVCSSGTKNPVRRYTADGNRMTPDDLRRLHDYLVDVGAKAKWQER